MTELLELEVVHNCGVGGLQDGLEVREKCYMPFDEAIKLAEQEAVNSWKTLFETSGISVACTLCARIPQLDKRTGFYRIKGMETIQTFPTYHSFSIIASRT